MEALFHHQQKSITEAETPGLNGTSEESTVDVFKNEISFPAKVHVLCAAHQPWASNNFQNAREKLLTVIELVDRITKR